MASVSRQLPVPGVVPGGCGPRRPAPPLITVLPHRSYSSCTRLLHSRWDPQSCFLLGVHLRPPSFLFLPESGPFFSFRGYLEKPALAKTLLSTAVNSHLSCRVGWARHSAWPRSPVSDHCAPSAASTSPDVYLESMSVCAYKCIWYLTAYMCVNIIPECVYM